jgi:voltage-gated potassium channel
MKDQVHHDIGSFQILLVALSVFILAALAAEAALPLTQPTRAILQHIDAGICILFLWDFFHRLLKAPDKRAFLKWGWIDLVSSIPMLPTFRWGRAVRVIRVMRVLRGVRSVRTIGEVLFRNRARGTFATALFACLLVVCFSSIAILHVESDAESNIKNPGDALWWSLTTVTTVGYGDRFPVTAEGRLIGAFLMTAGVGLFAIFTAYLASFFVETNKSDNHEELLLRLDSIERQLQGLQGQTAEPGDNLEISTR